MLGEKIGEFTGKTTGRRVVPNDEHGPKMEISFEQVGTLLGTQCIDYGTYEAAPVGKHLEGTGLGIIMTPDGDMVNWRATGVGNFTGKGQGVNWRGSLTYSTQSTKFSKLNGLSVIFEYDIDETGNNSKGRVFEWK